MHIYMVIHICVYIYICILNPCSIAIGTCRVITVWYGKLCPACTECTVCAVCAVCIVCVACTVFISQHVQYVQ